MRITRTGLTIAAFLILLSACAQRTAKVETSSQPSRAEIPVWGTEEFKKSINQRMLLHAGEFNECFEKQIAKDKTFSARKIMSLFTITQKGTVEAASIVAIDPMNDEFKDCFKSIIENVAFEPLPVNDHLLIFYPVYYSKRKTN